MGVKISLGSSLDFGLAVTELGAGSSEDIYWAGRSTLISRPEDILSLIHISEPTRPY